MAADPLCFRLIKFSLAPPAGAESSAIVNGQKMPRADWDVLKTLPVVIPKGKVAENFPALVAGTLVRRQALIFHVQNLQQTCALELPRLLSGRVKPKVKSK